ncbi:MULTISPECIES: KAP family P-loop NTPase fold protein [Azospirillum]|uniref:P-loop NTPase fold protein n=1 Tax=Azospirillum brasilense TaxID=192 RepID=A0ABU4PGG2_AZOBR|nr:MULTISPECIES: P-loop NTPase fold protein [Azospirillum]MDX5955871.1 P-loop NTPase fold protein [Azospirillum brasilense]PWC87412.1 hypothetical protein AEJ54_25675 [Azospirillum sp. Sp 7]
MSHRPDRPIADPADDRLGRDGFVSRLARALVREEAVDGGTVARASGVVVGLTGPWGSGKSSLLNLLAAEITRRHPTAVVVRFDPWLVSGRDDVITQFFAELIRQIQEVGTNNPQVGKVATRLTGRLTKYAANLAPATAWLGLPIPGLREALKAVGDALDHPESLAAQRTDLITSLAGVEVPIVVLIDELDRVEDPEVRAVAQLVRAIADFPGISYLLAYDRDRVVEALGGGNAERGGAYLEKIVQLEIPLPIAVDSETRGLFTAEFEGAVPAGVLPDGWHSDPRWRRLLAIAIDGLLTTPRDSRRVCGMYAVLAPMVAGEVDWLDLLGYCILLTKAPATVDAIRQQPSLVLSRIMEHQESNQGFTAFREAGSRAVAERLARLGATPTTPLANLLTLLFPRMLGSDTELAETVDGFHRRQPLMTVLRLGLLPGAVARSEIIAFLSLSDEAMLTQLRIRHAEQTLDSFLERLRDIYGDIATPNVESLLWVLGRVPRDIDLIDYCRTGDNYTRCQWFDGFLRCAVLRWRVPFDLGLRTLNSLIEAGHLDAVAMVLRCHVSSHGLYGEQKEDVAGAWLPSETVEGLSSRLVDALVAYQQVGTLLSVIGTPEPLFLANNLNRWNEDCRKSLTEQILADNDALRAVTLLFYGYGHLLFARLNHYLDAALFLDRLTAIADNDTGWCKQAWTARTRALHWVAR